MKCFYSLQNKPHPSDPRWAGLIPPVAVTLALPGAHSRAPATAHELGGRQTHGASQEVLTTWSSLGHLNHLKQRDSNFQITYTVLKERSPGAQCYFISLWQ